VTPDRVVVRVPRAAPGQCCPACQSLLALPLRRALFPARASGA
jgi:hypothetical protein